MPISNPGGSLIWWSGNACALFTRPQDTDPVSNTSKGYRVEDRASGDQYDLPCGLTRFKVAMGECRLGKRQSRINSHGEGPGADPVEQIRCPLQQFRSIECIVHQVGTGQIQGPFGAEHLGVQRRHRPTGLAVEHEVAARLEAVQALVEGGLPDRVVDYVDALAIGQALGFRFEVYLRIEDYLISAGL